MPLTIWPTAKNLWTALLLLLLSLSLSFGSGGCGAAKEDAASPGQLSLAQAEEQLDRLPRPDGVDPGQFEALRSGLREQLTTLGVLRWAAAVPENAANQVVDLQLAKVDDFTATASWTYTNVGDYNVDGLVSVNDLAPIGIFFQARSTDANWSTAQSADGNSDGIVSVNDLTPIGLNFQNSIDSYMVQASATPEVEASWAPAGFALLADSSQSAPGAPRTFSAEIPAATGFFYRVVPMYQGESGIPGAAVEYTGQAGGALDFEDYQAFFDAMDAKVQDLQSDSSAGQDIELANYMATLPNIEAAGFENGNAWARFTDGRLYLLIKNMAPNDQQAVSRATLSTSRTASAGLPASDFVDLMHGFGPGTGYSNVVNQLDSMFSAHNYLSSIHEASPDDIKVSDCGIFYYQSHSGLGKDRLGQLHFTFTLDTPVTGQNIHTWSDDLDATRLVFCQDVWNALNQKETVYGFTDKFVSEYMSFAPQSVVFLNCCASMGVPEMREAFKAKGASVVLGWDSLVENHIADIAALHFFDRCLGANLYSRTEVPPIRPFDYLSVLGDLQLRGTSAAQPVRYPPTPLPGTEFNHLVFSAAVQADQGFTLLAPSIEYAAIPGFDGQLVLSGDFGDTPGRLFVGGTEIACQWSPQEVTAMLPNSGAGAAGDVYVMVGAQKSNTRRLTEWRGKVNFEHLGPGSLRRNVSFSVHLRADLGSFRDVPYADPLLWGEEGVDRTTTVAALDCTAAVSSDGSFTNPDTDCTTTWSDGPHTVIGVDYGPPLDGEYWRMIGYFDTAALEFGFTEMSIAGMYTDEQVCENGGGHSPQLTGFGEDVLASLQLGGLGFVFTIPVDENYNVAPGQKPVTFSDDGDDSYQVSWTEMPASFIPDLTAAR